MTTTPTLIANRVEAQAHDASVRATDVLSAGLRRVVLVSPDFRDATIEPCDVTAFRVSRNAFRHYTPALVDDDALTIVFQRHGHEGATPGHDLVEGWSVGDPVKVCRWSSARAFTWAHAGPASEGRPVVLLGDATVISLALCMAERAEREGRDLVVALEVPAPDVDATRALVPRATVLPALEVSGAVLDAWVRANVEGLRLLGDPVAYLAGNGPAIQRQRTLLRDVVGLDRKAVRTQPYWAEGKAGL
jgi:NADPH-dependent ferric siderophore reductase